MREIKFRAFDDGKMIYESNITHLLMEDNLVLRLAKFWSNIRNDSFVMQFTGLIDKNGKEIYEGDIVRTTGYFFIDDERLNKSIINSVSIITYRDASAAFCLKDPTCPLEPPIFFEMVEMHERETIVIGNIYENPELLK